MPASSTSSGLPYTRPCSPTSLACSPVSGRVWGTGLPKQDVARGNQPWYYYFVGLSVYELLPLVFGVTAIIYFFRRQDAVGLALALWAALSLVAYTMATEKMPWLLVNITTPFILVAAKYLGELSGQLKWQPFPGESGRPSLDMGSIVAFAIFSCNHGHRGLSFPAIY